MPGDSSSDTRNRMLLFVSLSLDLGWLVHWRSVGVHPHLGGCLWIFGALHVSDDATQQARERARVRKIPKLLIVYKLRGGKGEPALGRDLELVPRDGRI
jgi:hypothetical protein